MVPQSILDEKGQLGLSLPGLESVRVAPTPATSAWQEADAAIRAITKLPGACCYCYDEQDMPSPPNTTSASCAFHKLMLVLTSRLHRIARHCREHVLQSPDLAALWGELNTLSASDPQSDRHVGMQEFSKRVLALMAELGVTEDFA